MDQILADVGKVLDGWTEVPGFGLRKIDLSPETAKNPADLYAQRLLWRLDFLRPLTRAALVAEDPEPYLTAVENYLNDWQQTRRSLKTWDSVDESIRVLNLLEVLALLGDRLDPKSFSAGLASVIDAAWTVQAQRARTGNHLIYEGLALYYAGRCLLNYVQSPRWKRLGKRILEKAIRLQVLEDGLNAELSTNYHLITGTNFLKGWILSVKCAENFSLDYQRKLAKMAHTAAQLQCADGGFSALGDSDRMAAQSREEIEGRAFAELGRILDRSENHTELSDELTLLLANLNPNEIFGEGTAYSVGIQSFGGYQFLIPKSGGKLIFDAAPFGLPGASHHGHADSLSFEVFWGQCRFLVDPGGFSYVDAAARSFARSTRAHNTIEVDGENSSEILGSFKFGRAAKCRLLNQQVFDWGYLVAAEHDGYTRLPNPVVHRRAIIWQPEPFLLLIADQLRGQGNSRFKAFFHADSDCEAEIESGNTAIWRLKGTDTLQQTFWSNAKMESKVIVGEREPELQGWVSPAFGTYLTAPALIETGESSLPVDLINCFSDPVLLPLKYEFEAGNHRVTLADDTAFNWSWKQEGLILSRT
ncbi:MAG: alginate lyase family protein [bacterium]|nr:alginate lyase family protein [bacterium]